MIKTSFFTNKYALSVILLVCCLLADIILHRGMSRVIIPATFTEKRKPQNFKNCNAPLIHHTKRWLKSVGNIAEMQQLPKETDGFQLNVYFNADGNILKIHNDSLSVAALTADTLLNIYKQRNLTASLWFNLKNLNEKNSAAIFFLMLHLRQQYNLFNKIIIVSDAPQYLNNYCDSGFFTGYNVPNFNPYKMPEDTLVKYIDIMAFNLKKFPVSAVAGSYFQYPVLKKYFPNFPILTWTDKTTLSLVSSVFNTRLENDPQVKIVLYPYQ